jgi:hypothetical protein
LIARRPWLSAYLIAATAAGGLGIATAPGTHQARADVTGALYETRTASTNVRIASIAPSLEWALPRKSFLMGSVAIAPAGAKFGNSWYEHIEGAQIEGAKGNPPIAKAAAAVARQERVAKRATGQPDKSATTAASEHRKAARVASAEDVPWPAPLPERFAAEVQPADTESPVILAYADPSPTAVGGALDSLANGQGSDVEADAAQQDSDEGLSDEVPLPLTRPNIKQPIPSQPKADKAETADQNTDDEARPDIAPAAPPRDKETKVALARPDNPDKPSGGGGWLGRLFGSSGDSSTSGSSQAAGGGVAVYDISAAKVYMPDGSTLEAHSGVGQMADNPRYVNVKMAGPTPPQTYVLKMREQRFHGVEAIRMLPVDGKNLYGRGGFLTHSYLLRGRRAQSHGCVAFADYERFLKAFKSGKIKKMVVVASGGRSAIRMAKNGESLVASR